MRLLALTAVLSTLISCSCMGIYNPDAVKNAAAQAKSLCSPDRLSSYTFQANSEGKILYLTAVCRTNTKVYSRSYHPVIETKFE